MSTNAQGMLEWRLSGLGLGTTGTGKGQKGSSYPSRLKAGFPDSPITHNDIDRASQTGIMQTLLLENAMALNPDFGTVSLTYRTGWGPYGNGPPDISVGGGVPIASDDHGAGWPATPFVPNVVSPGQVVGATNLSNATIDRSHPDGAASHSIPPGSGEGSALTPSVSSQIIGEQDFTTLTKGSSS